MDKMGKINKIESMVKKFSKNYLIVILFVAMGFILYGNTFYNPMFLDDYDVIVNNKFIKDWSYFPDYFSNGLTSGSGIANDYWRPMLLLIYSVEWHIWQDWLPGYHFVDISFHIINAILLFHILLYLFKKRSLAFFTALIFLIHPLQTEAVTWITGLADAFSVFFIFSGILFYLKFRSADLYSAKKRFYFLSLAAYILAIMSKEAAIIMPALIFIIDFFFLDQLGDFSLKEKFTKIAKAVWPFLLVSLIYFLFRMMVLNFINTLNLTNKQNIYTTNFHIRLFFFFRIITVYFGLLFWPINLNVERTPSSVSVSEFLSSPLVDVGGLILLCLLVLAFTQFKRLPILSFGILWFFIGLAPSSNLAVPMVALLYEHWLYLPLIGIFLIAIWLLEFFSEKYRFQKTALLFLTFFTIFLSVLTIFRNRDWRDPVILFEQVLRRDPLNYRITNGIIKSGEILEAKGNYGAAETLYQRALFVAPGNRILQSAAVNVKNLQILKSKK